MPKLCRRRRGALEELREASRRAKEQEENEKAEEERLRLKSELDRLEDRRRQMEDRMEDLEYLELQKLNVFNISSYYIGYDGLFHTERMSAMLFNELAEASGYLTPQQRDQLYGPSGFVNQGTDPLLHPHLLLFDTFASSRRCTINTAKPNTPSPLSRQVFL